MTTVTEAALGALASIALIGASIAIAAVLLELDWQRASRAIRRRRARAREFDPTILLEHRLERERSSRP